jgi:hypothetical protein
MATGQARLDAIDQQIQGLNDNLAARRLLSAGPHVRQTWEAADIEWRRRVLGLLVEKVVINPSDISGMTKEQRFMGKWTFKPEDVEVIWRA